MIIGPNWVEDNWFLRFPVRLPPTDYLQQPMRASRLGGVTNQMLSIPWNRHNEREVFDLVVCPHVCGLPRFLKSDSKIVQCITSLCVSRTETPVFTPLEVSHEVSQRLKVSWRQQLQGLVERLQTFFGVCNLCETHKNEHIKCFRSAWHRLSCVKLTIHVLTNHISSARFIVCSVSPALAWFLNTSVIRSGILCSNKLEDARRPTCSFDEAWVGIIRDEGNRQLSEVEFEGSGDDVDVLVSVWGNISLLSICGAKSLVNIGQAVMWYIQSEIMDSSWLYCYFTDP